MYESSAVISLCFRQLNKQLSRILLKLDIDLNESTESTDNYFNPYLFEII